MNAKARRGMWIGACLALSLPAVAAAGMLDFDFDDSNFNDSTTLQNDFWGLRIAGPVSAVLFSESDDGCEVSESLVVGTTGTGFFDDPYDINAVVIRDREWVSEECDGQFTLVEDTHDWYAEDYFRYSPYANPRGPESGEGRVLKGGSFTDPTVNSRAATRYFHDPNSAGINRGFRCVLSQ